MTKTKRAYSSKSPTRQSKVSKTTDGDTPSKCSSRIGGRQKVDANLRSVLSHPLALPLVSALVGKDPSKLKYFSKKSQYFEENGMPSMESTSFDDIFAAVFNPWSSSDTKPKETDFTRALAAAINESVQEESGIGKTENETWVHDNTTTRSGRIDILINSTKDTDKTPLAIVEVGLASNDWWSKVDQNYQYLDLLGDRFSKPLLFAVLTVEGGGGTDIMSKPLEVKLGIFLCSPKKSSGHRMTFLWSSKATDLDTATKAFGKLMRATSDFSHWRDEYDPDESGYLYLGPNCCRVRKAAEGNSDEGEQQRVVLRSYDNRLRRTDRKMTIYKDWCTETETIFELESNSNDDGDAFVLKDGTDPLLWPDQGRLEVIAVPHHEGRHFAKRPKEFLPIIDKLGELHKAGFVHGDIRCFNTIFSEVPGQGWLIDFDFGGNTNAEDGDVLKYPGGYQDELIDGSRIGRGDETIEQWHDYYALGNLLFQKHRFISPPSDASIDIKSLFVRWLLSLKRHFKSLSKGSAQWRLDRTYNKWKYPKAVPSEDMIKELKELLIDLDEIGWTLQTNPKFRRVLDSIDDASGRTEPNATGSAARKKIY